MIFLQFLISWKSSSWNYNLKRSSLIINNIRKFTLQLILLSQVLLFILDNLPTSFMQITFSLSTKKDYILFSTLISSISNHEKASWPKTFISKKRVPKFKDYPRKNRKIGIKYLPDRKHSNWVFWNFGFVDLIHRII